MRKVNIRLFEEDITFLEDTYNADGKGVGYNEVVRRIVNDHCNHVKDKINERLAERKEQS